LAPTPSGATAGIPYGNPGGWFDVTSGKNTKFCRSGYLCQAVAGYDGPTGLGTPNGAIGFGGSAGSPGPNAAPTADFTWTCTSLDCTFTDASTDPDGNATITGRSWTFGDGGSSTATNPAYHYGAAGNYTVTLTVTDDGGLTDPVSHSVAVTAASVGITLTAQKVTRGTNKVNLSWTGAASTVDVYRNNVIRTTVTGSAYTDNVGKGSGSFTYKVCNAGTTTCSDPQTVTF
jgi:PKD repeat protein